MTDRAFMDCMNELDEARLMLRKLEKLTCRIAAQRKTVSTGQACLQAVADAKEALGKIARHLARYEARLQQLAEGVDAGAAVR